MWEDIRAGSYRLGEAMSHDFQESAEQVNPGCKSISVGYRGQKYEIQYVDHTGIWKTFGWQDQEFGGLLQSVSLWPEAKRYRLVEVEPELRAIFRR